MISWIKNLFGSRKSDGPKRMSTTSQRTAERTEGPKATSPSPVYKPTVSKIEQKTELPLFDDPFFDHYLSPEVPKDMVGVLVMILKKNGVEQHRIDSAVRDYNRDPCGSELKALLREARSPFQPHRDIKTYLTKRDDDDFPRTSSSPISDIRAKKNIQRLSGSLSKIMAMNGVSFEWTDEIITGAPTDHKGNIGLIAQDVEGVLPELVGRTKGGLRTIRYQYLVAVLVEGMKEQQTQIDELKSRLLSLEA